MLADSALEQKLKRLMLLRVVMVTTLLLIAVYVEMVSETLLRVNPLYFLIANWLAMSIRVIADLAIQAGGPWITGANVADAHYRHTLFGRDFTVERFADIRDVMAGDPCPRCVDGVMEQWRGIEVGHVFKLGTKYSAAMRATVLDDQGQERVLVMGCYGIGVGRTVAASIEQNHDDKGIIWPMPIAPFQVLITLVNPKDEAVRSAGDRLYAELQEVGVEVLLDDRAERPGSKFADADLLGIPLRVTVGSRALQEGALVGLFTSEGKAWAAQDQVSGRLGSKSVVVPTIAGDSWRDEVVGDD